MPEIDADFHDTRISMLWWLPRVAELDVPVPKTRFANNESVYSPEEVQDMASFSRLDPRDIDAEEASGLPASEISSVIRDEFSSERAHIRGDFASASYGGERGEFINTNELGIYEECMFLGSSLAMSQMPFNALVFREEINVKTYSGVKDSIIPEVRFIVDEGEVLGSHLRNSKEEFMSTTPDERATEVFDDMRQRMNSANDKLEKWARQVAQRLDTTGWSVDFIQSESGNWFLTDMSLYGIYWNNKKNMWMNISNIPEDQSYNIVTNRQELVPSPKNQDENKSVEDNDGHTDDTADNNDTDNDDDDSDSGTVYTVG